MAQETKIGMKLEVGLLLLVVFTNKPGGFFGVCTWVSDPC